MKKSNGMNTWLKKGKYGWINQNLLKGYWESIQKGYEILAVEIQEEKEIEVIKEQMAMMAIYEAQIIKPDGDMIWIELEENIKP